MSDEHTPFALVVDDDALIRMDASDILEEAGFLVLEGETSGEALSVLDQRGDNVSFSELRRSLAMGCDRLCHPDSDLSPGTISSIRLLFGDIYEIPKASYVRSRKSCDGQIRSSGAPSYSGACSSTLQILGVSRMLADSARKSGTKMRSDKAKSMSDL